MRIQAIPALFVGFWLAAAPAVAQQAAEPLANAPEAARPNPDERPLLERLEAEVLVDLVAVRNAEKPASGRNFVAGGSPQASRDRELGLDLAALELSLPAEPVGFRLVAGAGDSVEALHAGEPGEGADRLGPLVFATVAWQAAPRWRFEAGLSPSHIGFESAFAGANWNVTPSWTATFSPYYQLGLSATYAIDDEWSAGLYAVNGWQTATDANDAASWGGRLAWARGDWSAALNGWWGPERAGDESHARSLVDLVATVPLADDWSLGVEAYRGREERPGGSANWSSAALYLRFEATERVALAARAERFEDPDAGISGLAQTLESATLTLGWRVAAPLVLRAEARADRSTALLFDGRDGEATAKSQRLLLVAAHLGF